MRRNLAGWCLGMALGSSLSGTALAWGDEGHEIVGLIAEHYLAPSVRVRAEALLAVDSTGLCDRDIAHESTWADKYRDSDRDGSGQRYYATRNWHFVDLELNGPDLDRACRGRPGLPAGVAASAGPAEACLVDKVDQFREELRSPGTDDRERLLALQFVLHLVGDLHQPLHAADDHDQGGNREIVSAPGIGTESLHHDWDTEFPARLGADPRAAADRLIAHISEAQRREWSRGTPAEWALESFSVARTHAYGLLPAPWKRHRYDLPESYAADAAAVSAVQLSKAGVRLAFLLNQALR